MKYAIIKEIHGPEGLGGASNSYFEFESFASQEALKKYIKKHPNTKHDVIEYQELQVNIETKVDFKRPAATRTS